MPTDQRLLKRIERALAKSRVPFGDEATWRAVVEAYEPFVAQLRAAGMSPTIEHDAAVDRALFISLGESVETEVCGVYLSSLGRFGLVIRPTAARCVRVDVCESPSGPASRAIARFAQRARIEILWSRHLLATCVPVPSGCVRTPRGGSHVPVWMALFGTALQIPLADDWWSAYERDAAPPPLTP